MIKKKAIYTIFAILFLVFVVVWVTKAKSPTTKVDATQSKDAGAWYNKEVVTTPSDDWILDPEIPENYIPVPGEDEVYMVIDTQGTVTSYRQRTKAEDGSWIWATIEKTDTNNQNDYQLVASNIDGDVYSVTSPEGDTSYMRYVRNEDNGYAFVDCDDTGADLDTPKNSEIPKNYIWVTGNVYAVYNENGVLTGYKERFVDENDNYFWVAVPAPDLSAPETPEVSTESSISGIIADGTIDQSGTVPNDDGSYTSTTTYQEQKTVGNYVITYKTEIIKKYDVSGELISTNKKGPYEVARSAAIIQKEDVDQSKILSLLDEEVYRVSSDKQFNTDIAEEVLDLLNSERRAFGLGSVSLDDSSAIYKLVKLKAADMAIYDHSNANSEMYGYMGDLGKRYNISIPNSSENLFKTMPITADQIHSRFQAVTSSREARMSKSITKMAIAVIEYNGYYYIYEFVY